MSQNSMIEYIEHDNSLYAIIIRQKLEFKGYNFVSKAENGLQVGVNHYPGDTVAVPHVHLPLPRSLEQTNEVLHIDVGECKLVLYTDARERFHETTLFEGDTVVLLKGGHGVRFLKPTKIIEIKQGPYLGPELDKVKFEDPNL